MEVYAGELGEVQRVSAVSLARGSLDGRRLDEPIMTTLSSTLLVKHKPQIRRMHVPMVSVLEVRFVDGGLRYISPTGVRSSERANIVKRTTGIRSPLTFGFRLSVESTLWFILCFFRRVRSPPESLRFVR